MKQIVCVLGEGAWGTAIASVLARNGHPVRLWCHHQETAPDIINTGYNNRYLPAIQLPPNIIPFANVEEAVEGVSILFEAIPIKYLRSVLEKVKPYYSANQRWVILSKGIEHKTLLLPLQIMNEVMQTRVDSAVLMGPSFAQEVAHQQMTGVVAAAASCDTAQYVQQICSNNYFKVTLSTDVIGVQLCAAYKNVIALAAGYLEGAGYGANAQALLITRGLSEMATLVTALGGEISTVYQLAGVGDLLLTATGKLSRNRHVGMLLGEGNSLEDILDSTGYTPEGINTLQSVHALMQRYSIELPICQMMYELVFESQRFNLSSL